MLYFDTCFLYLYLSLKLFDNGEFIKQFSISFSFFYLTSFLRLFGSSEDFNIHFHYIYHLFLFHFTFLYGISFNHSESKHERRWRAVFLSAHGRMALKSFISLYAIWLNVFSTLFISDVATELLYC